MNQTQNYQLNQWEMTDLIKMEDFNGDNSKVDAALKTLAGQVAGKANSATVSSLSTKVNTKAAQSDLTAAVNRVTALESGKADKTALESEIAAREAADGALGARVDALVPKAGAQLLQSITLTENAATVDLSLADLDMSQWRTFYVMAAPQFSSDTDYKVFFNGSSSNAPFGAAVTGRSMIVLYPMFTPELPLSGFCASSTVKAKAIPHRKDAE